MTEYRIVTINTFLADRFLQFRSTRTKRPFPWHRTVTEDCWRFIPEMSQHIFGYWSEQDCPTQLPGLFDTSYMHSFHKQEDFNLIPFTKRYPDIQPYFDAMNQKYDEYLKERAEAAQAPTTYL
jgi:hypothetical protein